MEPLRIKNATGVARLNWRISAKADSADIDLYDQIGQDFWGDGTSAADFVQELRGLDVSTINLHINSPGGFIDDALAMYHGLQQHRATVVAHVEGIAASAASVVAMAADSILIAPHARMMIHDAMAFLSVFTQSNVQGMDDLISRFSAIRDVLDQESNNIASIYAERAGGTAQVWRGRMQANGDLGTTYRGQEAVDIGLADGIDEVKPRDERSGRMVAFANPPADSEPEDDGDDEDLADLLKDIPSLANGYEPPLIEDLSRLVEANLTAAKGA